MNTTLNVFAAAKQNATTTTAKKTTKDRINFKTEINTKRWAEIKDLMDDLEAEKKAIEYDIKQLAKDKVCELDKIESFTLNANVMVIPMDKYTVLNADTVSLVDESIVETTTTFSFNEVLLARYMDVISEAIGSLDIPDEDKAVLIQAKTSHKIKSGTLALLPAKNKEDRADFLGLINPIIMLKKA